MDPLRELRVPSEEPSPSPRHGQHPLTRRDVRKQVVYPRRRALGHPPAPARRTETSSLTGEWDDSVMIAVLAPEPGEAARGISARQEPLELPLHVSRQRPLHGGQGRAQTREAFADNRVQVVVERTTDLERDGHERRRAACGVPRTSRHCPIPSAPGCDGGRTNVAGLPSVPERQEARDNGSPRLSPRVQRRLAAAYRVPFIGGGALLFELSRLGALPPRVTISELGHREESWRRAGRVRGSAGGGRLHDRREPRGEPFVDDHRARGARDEPRAAPRLT